MHTLPIVHAHRRLCVEARDQCHIFFHGSSLSNLFDGVPQGTGSHKWLASKHISTSPARGLVPTSLALGSQEHVAVPSFYLDVGDHTQVLMLTQQELLPTEVSLSQPFNPTPESV